MLRFCVKKIPNVLIKFITKHETDVGESHESSFDNVKAIPDTPSFHQFLHIGDNKIGMKYCCNDETYDTECSFHNGISFEQENVSMG